MDTNVFLYCLEVEESKSITLAAKHLFISQPALSKQLNKLEKELGFQIFDRARSPITVTPQGELFLSFARRYAEMEKEFLEGLRQFSPVQTEPVRIATTHRGGAYAGVQTASFMLAHPEITLEYTNRSSSQCEEDLENEAADLAIYTEPVRSDKLEYMPVQEDPLVFVIPTNSPVLKGLDLSGNALENPVRIEPHRFRDPAVRYVLSTQGQGLYYAENAFFKKYRVTPIHPQRIDYVDTRYQVACGGCGIALLPHMTIRDSQRDDNVIYGMVKGEDLYRYVVVARKKGRQLSPAAETVWRFMVGTSAKIR